MPDVRIGISGWTYDHWYGDFYPEGLPRRRQLEFAGQQFNSIEVNGSFYSLIKPETWRRYYETTPSNFLFAIKGSRFITHTKKLKDIRTPLANFFASGLLELKEKLGPILWQFPSRGPGLDRFHSFLEILPRDTEAASKLARTHDHRLKGKAFMDIDRKRRLRHALEIRDPGLLSSEFVHLVRRYGTTLVFSDSGQWPYIEEITAGYVYLRLHGAPQTYTSRYSDQDLDRWANKIRCWISGREPSQPHRITGRKPPRRKTRDAYIYFDNDSRGHAPHDARRLMERLSVMGEADRTE